MTNGTKPFNCFCYFRYTNSDAFLTETVLKIWQSVMGFSPRLRKRTGFFFYIKFSFENFEFMKL